MDTENFHDLLKMAYLLNCRELKNLGFHTQHLFHLHSNK